MIQMQRERTVGNVGGLYYSQSTRVSVPSSAVGKSATGVNDTGGK
jgi:hypothetical protein